MSEFTVAVTFVFAVLVIIGVGVAGFVFFFLPRAAVTTVSTLVDGIASGIHKAVGVTPRITVNQKVYIAQSKEIFELAVEEREVRVDHELRHEGIAIGVMKIPQTSKRLRMEGVFRTKIGFDLRRGFQVDWRSGKKDDIEVRLPHAEVLSVEPLSLSTTDEASSLLNRLRKEDRDDVNRQLIMKAHHESATVAALKEAEEKVKRRISEVLVSKLGKKPFAYEMKFLDATGGKSSDENNASPRSP